MGPRSCERGKLAQQHETDSIDCGLQWGRVRVNAESLRGSSKTPKGSSFNGAAFV